MGGRVVLVLCWSSASRMGLGEPVKGSQPCTSGAAPPGRRRPGVACKPGWTAHPKRKRSCGHTGQCRSSDPHTPAGFGAWDYVAMFLGLFAGQLCSAQLGSVQPSSVWPCQCSGSALQECGAAGCARLGCPCWGGDPPPATGGCAGAPVSLSLHFDSHLDYVSISSVA